MNARSGVREFPDLLCLPVSGIGTLVESDEQAGAPLVVVIGHDLWQSRFKGDPRVIGRTVHLTGAPSTIVGVMPERFAFPRTQELWVPPVDGASSCRCSPKRWCSAASQRLWG